MKTYEAAKAALKESGYEGEPTPEAIKAAGWDPTDAVAEAKAIGSQQPLCTKEQIDLDLAALAEERKANSIPSQILPIVERLIGIAVKV